MTTKTNMETTSQDDNNIARMNAINVINDSGGGMSLPLRPPNVVAKSVVDSSTNSGDAEALSRRCVVEQHQATVANEASTCGGGDVRLEEGIIYRNPQSSSSCTTSNGPPNSKVHFISNLTLYAKQQQASPRTTGQNIIFLNNAPGNATTGAASKLSSTATATNSYINAFVSKGIATTATGKVVNLLQTGPKAGPPPVLVTKPQLLKRTPAQQQQQQHRSLQQLAVNRNTAAQLQAAQRVFGASAAASTPKAHTMAAGKIVHAAADTQKQLGGVGKLPKASAVAADSVAKQLKGTAIGKYHHPKVVQVHHSYPQEDKLSAGGKVLGGGKGNAPKSMAASAVVAGKCSVYNNPLQLVVSSNGGSGGYAIPSPTTSSSGGAGNPIKYVKAPQPSEQLQGEVAITSSSSTVEVCDTDEVYYVNGTQMNDEMSARLLQNFSQKAASRYAPPSGHYYTPSTQLRPTTDHAQELVLEAANGLNVLGELAEAAVVNVSSRDGNNNDGRDSEARLSDDRDEHIGEEVRPKPPPSADERASVLHAILQDHTYVLLRSPSNEANALGVPVGTGCQLPSYGGAIGDSSLAHKELGAALALADVGNRVAKAGGVAQPLKCTTNDLLHAAMGLGHYPLSSSVVGGGGGDDDDNCSVISNDSRRSGRHAGDNDLGEETETAPEGEGEEEDSVTRCICDLTHDDGYMICCDKCSTWQHVDCMGIDRLNIPDEYKCDVCQPRFVDRVRARELQMLKRREQQNAAMLQGLQPGGVQLGPAFGALPTASDHPLPLNEMMSRSGAKQVVALGSPVKKGKGPFAGGRRKSDLGSAAATAFAAKKQQRKEMLKNGSGNRRKEKKTLSRKQRTTSGAPGLRCDVSAGGVLGAAAAAEDKPRGAMVDVYETAITNHYSPELRARLQAICKQNQQYLGSPVAAVAAGGANLRNIGDLIGKCTTVPHAGGKILISTVEIAAGEPIVELRGKYMLSGQYRQSAASVVQATSTGRNHHQGNTAAAMRPGGPFIFFYRLVKEATELCVDTRTYGNDARFVRRSCRPNAEIVHHVEKGTIHLYIVSVQGIRSSTEITIKHEPHDLLAVSRASSSGVCEVPAPTSTSCGCGLDKDCLFYNAAAVDDKRLNGTVQKAAATGGGLRGSGVGGGGVGSFRRRNSKVLLRNSRSTSSSGESSGSLMSPNNVATGGLPMAKGSCAAEGAAAAEKVEEKSSAAAEVKAVKAAKEESTGAELVVPSLSEGTNAAAIIKQEGEGECQKREQLDNSFATVKKEDPLAEEDPRELKPNMAQLADVHDSAVKSEAVDTEEDEMKAAVATENQPVPGSQRKNKELKSLNETLKAGGSMPLRTSCEENRKLTREERKMEAIMKAFEKMEKSSSRKQEGRKNNPSNLSERRNSSSHGHGGNELPIFRKKKRKGSKSYQQPTQRRIRRKSSTSAVHEDVFTSEESTGSLLASPPISVPYTYASSRTSAGDTPLETHNSFSRDQHSAVNMLLSLANSTSAGEVSVHDEAQPLGRPTMSSAYGPLADFKVPKTKKSIMNDWLSADKSAEDGANLESLAHAATAAAATEEATNAGNSNALPEILRQDSMEAEAATTLDAINASFATPPSVAGSESAVKKRWLRQAISEECSDEAPPSPTNGYAATPLKKRRFARQCSDLAEGVAALAATPTTTGDCAQMSESPVSGVEKGRSLEMAVVVVEEEEEEEEEDETKAPQEPLKNAASDEQAAEATAPSERSPDDPVAEPKAKDEPKDLAEEPKTLPEQVQKDAAETIIPEEFDIKPLMPEEKSLVEATSAKSSTVVAAAATAASSTEEGNDEIADIQKRLHSFHAENILFLQSLNKKTKPNLSPPHHNMECHSAYSSASVSASSSATSSPISSPKMFASEFSQRRSTPLTFLGKRKRLDFDAEDARKTLPDERLVNNESPEKQHSRRRTKSRFSSPVPPPPPPTSCAGIEIKDLNSNTVVAMVRGVEEELGASYKATELSMHAPPTHSYFSAAGSAAPAVHHPVMMMNSQFGGMAHAKSTLFNASFGGGPVLDVGDPLIGSDVGCAPNLISPSPAATSRLLLSELLENAQKISTDKQPLMGGGSGGFLTLKVTPQAPPSKMTFNADVTGSGGTPPASRTLIRTASADPRLNPNLNTTPEPPPAPKRKLSINEYRKRMQQTPSGGNESANSSANGSPTGYLNAREASGGEEAEGSQSRGKDELADVILESLCDSSSESPSVDESRSSAEKGTFCAAPTLLERQQESISERLKSYKSVTELLTTKDGTPIIKTILQNSPLGTSILETLKNSVGVVSASRDGEKESVQEVDASEEQAMSPSATSAAAAAR